LSIGANPAQGRSAQAVAEVCATDRTGCDRAAILVEAKRYAVDGAAGDESIKIVRGLRAATILQAVFAAAELTALRSIDTPKPDARSMYFKRIAVDNAGLSNEIICERYARQKSKRECDWDRSILETS